MILIYKKSKIIINYIIIILCYTVIFNSCVKDNFTYAKYKERKFKDLNKIRQKKITEINKHFDQLYKNALSISRDQKMFDFFKALSTQKNLATDLKYNLDKHFIDKYNRFYDILFVNDSQYIFYSILQESDYKKNVYNPVLKDTLLARHIKQSNSVYFTDYEYYSPSREPASFFIIPVKEKNKTLGKFVLQYSINNLNLILSDHKELGTTGEIYLVNKKKLMMTKSRFINDDTVLKLKINTLAARTAFTEKKGNKIISDYRNIPVYSSYEIFNCLQNEWLIMVEQDEQEVISDYYLKYNKKASKELNKYLQNNQTISYSENSYLYPAGAKIKKVDMNEYSRNDENEMLETRGIGPCTGIIINYPGKFSYLSHVSPTDAVYLNRISALFLKQNYHTDFITEIINRIFHYEIYPYEKSQLRIYIIANHFSSLNSILKELINNNIFLSQIYFIYNQNADLANILFDTDNDSLMINWVSDYNYKNKYLKVENKLPVSEIIKKINNKE